jgi:hypothetical protein
MVNDTARIQSSPEADANDTVVAALLNFVGLMVTIGICAHRDIIQQHSLNEASTKEPRPQNAESWPLAQGACIDGSRACG